MWCLTAECMDVVAGERLELALTLKSIGAARKSSAWSRKDAGAIAVQVVAAPRCRAGAKGRRARGMGCGCMSIRSPTMTRSIGLGPMATGEVVGRCVGASGDRRTRVDSRADHLLVDLPIGGWRPVVVVS